MSIRYHLFKLRIECAVRMERVVRPLIRWLKKTFLLGDQEILVNREQAASLHKVFEACPGIDLVVLFGEAVPEDLAKEHITKDYLMVRDNEEDFDRVIASIKECEPTQGEVR